MQGVIEGVTNLFQGHLAILRSQIHETLEPVSAAVGKDIDDLFEEDGPFYRPFAGLETQYQQETFYRTHFNLTVSTICNIFISD